MSDWFDDAAKEIAKPDRPVEPAIAATGSEKPDLGTRDGYCASCRADLRVQDEFCPSCGASRSSNFASRPSPAAAAALRRRRLPLVLLVVFSAVVLLAGAGFGFVRWKQARRSALTATSSPDTANSAADPPTDQPTPAPTTQPEFQAVCAAYHDFVSRVNVMPQDAVVSGDKSYLPEIISVLRSVQSAAPAGQIIPPGAARGYDLKESVGHIADIEQGLLDGTTYDLQTMAQFKEMLQDTGKWATTNCIEPS